MPQPRRTSFRGCLQQSSAQRRGKKAASAKLPALLDRFLSVLEKKAPEQGFTHGLDFPTGADLTLLIHHICRLAFSGGLSGRRLRLAEQVSQDQGFGGTNAGRTWSQRVLVVVKEFRRHLFLSASSRCVGVPVTHESQRQTPGTSPDIAGREIRRRLEPRDWRVEPDFF